MFAKAASVSSSSNSLPDSRAMRSSISLARAACTADADAVFDVRRSSSLSQRMFPLTTAMSGTEPRSIPTT